ILLKKRDKGELQMWFIAWGPDFADPHNYAWAFVYSHGGYMMATGYFDAAVDDWIIQARCSSNRTERLELYGKIQERVAYDQPSIYFWQAEEFRVWRAWLRGSGLAFNPMCSIYWYHIYKDYST
ncbi:MAG: hypothetical protein JSW05_02700, partial [Candidatus Thorarchaeota archaeon]